MRFYKPIKNKPIPVFGLGLAVFTAAALVLFGCAPRHSGSDTSPAIEESDHADHDIAMTVMSLVDAVKVGEPLSDADYDYTGLLTDGQGAPLYTDLTGAPGEWRVKVLAPDMAELRNTRMGDLLIDDLRLYIAQQLNLPESLIVEQIDTNHDEVNEIVTYDFGAGLMRFQTTDTLEHPDDETTRQMLSILISSKHKPAGSIESGQSS